MAFKVAKSEFDWDVEVPIISEDGESKYETLKCVVKMNGDGYANFIKHLNSITKGKTEKKLTDEIGSDIESGILLVINQIDYLYKKGSDWWKENTSPETILAVQRHLIDFTNVIAEKKNT